MNGTLSKELIEADRTLDTLVDAFAQPALTILQPKVPRNLAGCWLEVG